ncbi:LANO_0A01486g1_1 [Lachancea nothofagi CBS 11611]|uniref:MAP kinase kinase kinase n=1 Tax=Lachancea nothofagi CBS 11611 TaxID=1266666 RepID=A0A1G4IMK0_9SACH|nr:LANO_0A01486g1_1 [Lachancea nothofagi CBS 11611]
MTEKDYFSFKQGYTLEEKAGNSGRVKGRSKNKSYTQGNGNTRSFSPSRQMSNLQGQQPRSPGYYTATTLRSPSGVQGHSPMNTLKLSTSSLKHAMSMVSPPPGAPSVRSSRQPSISGNSSGKQSGQNGSHNSGTGLMSPGRQKTRSNSLSSRVPSTLSLDSSLAPTLVLPPNLASLNSQSTSTLNSPQNQLSAGMNSASNNASSSSLHHDSTASSTSSTRSSHAASSNSVYRSFKPMQKQYVLNEELYLNRMKKSNLDDYYTRGIAASGNDEDDETDTEAEVDDTDADESSFGTNFFTTTEKGGTLTFDDELVTMSSKFLLGRMDWLRQADPENPDVKGLLGTQQRIPSGPSTGRTMYSTTVGTAEGNSYAYVQRLSRNSHVLDRLEWQAMLANVLKGDIVKSEKSKISYQGGHINTGTQYADELWLELKAWMNCRSIEEERKTLEYLRNSTDSVFDEIMQMKFDDNVEVEYAVSRIKPVINRYHQVTSYWKNDQHMQYEKPLTGRDEFTHRIAAMNTFLTLKDAFECEIEALKRWTGNESLDVKFTSTFYDIEGVYKNERPFAEQILKERDIESIFQRKLFYRHAPWILKAKVSIFTLSETVKEMKIPLLHRELEILLMFPFKLVKEIILIRLDYAKKLNNPTMMMIDQMIDDFSSYIRLSVQIKHTVVVYCSDWSFSPQVDADFDDAVNEAIKYLFKLLHLKLIDSAKKSFKTFREPDELLKFWDQLKNVGCFISGAGDVVAEGFSNLTLRLLNRLHSYILREQNHPPRFHKEADAEKWLIQVIENIGSVKRKINRFSNVLAKAFQNSVNYKVNDNQELLKNLKDSGHFLIYTGGELEGSGVYLFCSGELLGSSDEEILKILHNSEIGSDLLPNVEIKNSLSVYNALESGWDQNAILFQEYGANGVTYYHVQSEAHGRNTLVRGNRTGNQNGNNAFEDLKSEENEMFELEVKLKSLGYIVAYCPQEPILWEGDMLNLSEGLVLTKRDFDIKLPSDTLVLLNQGSTYAMEYQCDKFQHFVGNAVSFSERRCSTSTIEYTLQKINRAYFRITYTVLANMQKITDSVQKDYRGNETLNNLFIFCRDFARNFLRVNVATYEKKSIIILILMKISINWITFLVDDCDPTDLRTFRWCVPAMEFAMQMTMGWNILGLDQKQFSVLQEKISGCMSLLISHFDIMGARTSEAEKISHPQIRSTIGTCEDDNDSILAVNSKVRLEAIQELEKRVKGNPRHIGKVLDESDRDNQYLQSLASSLSNVSIRWQKRNFVGGGSFGTVFSAVNLDTGEILAVKEIKIKDRKSMKEVFPAIKEEMSVLEMLNHPNVVQYYGVEVHRDKVNLFMEYCEGGSLAQLLEHGRIEDEMVTQVYALQMLEGLAYLHQSSVVHRDIKPENILLDFNGVIKYVDFGAARSLAANGTKVANPATENKGEGVNSMMGTPMYMSPESVTGAEKGKFGSGDIWSLGCVILEMVTGRRPWFNLDNEWAIMYHVAAGHVPQLPSKDEVSSQGISFLLRCLKQDPNQRATAMELLCDPWMVEIRQLAFEDDGSDQQAGTPIV